MFRDVILLSIKPDNYDPFLKMPWENEIPLYYHGFRRVVLESFQAPRFPPEGRAEESGLLNNSSAGLLLVFLRFT